MPLLVCRSIHRCWDSLRKSIGLRRCTIPLEYGLTTERESRFPAQWDVYVAHLIREAHNVGLPIGVAIGYFVGDSVDASV
jgi:hypothetical protein